MPTGRERFLQTMDFAPCDRPPLWEEGIREEVWEAWGRQGGASSEEFSRHRLFDRRSTAEISLHPMPGFADDDPPDRFRRIGERYRHSVSERFPDEWNQKVKAWSNRDHPLGMVVSRGVFLSAGVGAWNTLEPLLFAMSDEPSVVEGAMERATELSLWALEKVSRETTLDFATFSEPIASFYSPLISPEHYRRFALPYYRRLVEGLREANVKVLVVQIYGNVEPLIPLWLEIGVNTLWCSHSNQAGMNYVALRHRYGRDLRLIGGIDTEMLQKGKAAIDETLINTVPPLLEEGGYVPLLDDRVRSTVPYENYCYYRTQLEKLVAGT